MQNAQFARVWIECCITLVCEFYDVADKLLPFIIIFISSTISLAYFSLSRCLFICLTVFLSLSISSVCVFCGPNLTISSYISLFYSISLFCSLFRVHIPSHLLLCLLSSSPLTVSHHPRFVPGFPYLL